MAVAFALLAGYVAVQSAIVLARGDHPGSSVVGAAWLAVTAAAMFALAYGKAETGRRLANPVLRTEARITSSTAHWRSRSSPACSSTPSPTGGGPTRPPRL
jgi:hypothetical protein